MEIRVEGIGWPGQVDAQRGLRSVKVSMPQTDKGLSIAQDNKAHDQTHE